MGTVQFCNPRYIGQTIFFEDLFQICAEKKKKHLPLSWCFCRNSSARPWRVCRSSCWVWIFVRPNAGQLRQDQWVWILHYCLPMRYNSRLTSRRAAQGEIATVESDHCQGRLLQRRRLPHAGAMAKPDLPMNCGSLILTKKRTACNQSKDEGPK